MEKLINYILLLVLIILVSGCVTVDINQKLYRDWTFDFSIEAKSDNQIILNELKTSFENNKFFEKAVLVEEENSFKYILEKVNLTNFSTTEEDSNIVESIGIKKEFKFPYYYYTITLKNERFEQDSEFGNFGMSVNYIVEPFGKIVDTNGRYVGEDKKKVKFDLMQSKEYYVKFRDFFLFSLFSGASSIENREAIEPEVTGNELDYFNEELEIEITETEVGGELITGDAILDEISTPPTIGEARAKAEAAFDTPSEEAQLEEPPELRVEYLSCYEDDYGYVRVEGKIYNKDLGKGRTARDVTVYVDFIKRDKIIDTDWGYPDKINIKAGEHINFNIWVDDGPSTWDECEVTLDYH